MAKILYVVESAHTSNTKSLNYHWISRYSVDISSFCIQSQASPHFGLDFIIEWNFYPATTRFMRKHTHNWANNCFTNKYTCFLSLTYLSEISSFLFAFASLALGFKLRPNIRTIRSRSDRNTKERPARVTHAGLWKEQETSARN